MTNDELVARARSVIGKGCLYGLGRGGRDPESEHPWEMVKNAEGVWQPRCDCTGLLAWHLGMDRHLDHPWYRSINGGWLESSAIVRDCGTPFGFFTEVPPGLARVGDVLVYGDRKNSDGTRRQGHVGIISEVGETGPAKAIHCSKGNERKAGDAIQETAAGLWIVAGGIVARHAQEQIA